jgi:CRP-like cAMP-binding protein
MATPTAQLKEFLTRTPFFGGLQDEGLDLVIGMLVERSLAVGELVFKEGATGRSMYIVKSGELVALQRAEGVTVPVKLMRLRPGDFFGETTLIDTQPRPFTARVDRAAVLYELTNMDLYRLYETDVQSYVMVLQNINRELCRRLSKTGRRLTRLASDFDDESNTQISFDHGTLGSKLRDGEG